MLGLPKFLTLDERKAKLAEFAAAHEARMKNDEEYRQKMEAEYALVAKVIAAKLAKDEEDREKAAAHPVNPRLATYISRPVKNEFDNYNEYLQSMREGYTWTLKPDGYYGYRALRANEMLDRGLSL